MRSRFAGLSIAVLGVGLQACASAGPARIPTLNFSQYVPQPGSTDAQVKSGIEISLKVLRLTDMYQHPDLFSFNLEEFPPQYSGNLFLKQNYPPDASGKRWAYWFANHDASEQLLICWAKIRNGTDHILRMRDARIYLVAEGQEPSPAYASFNDLVAQANNFDEEGNRWYLQHQTGLLKGLALQPPHGFAQAAVLQRRQAYKIINDVSREILPGFAFEGMLVFPVVPAAFGPVKVSFFDITTKTDPAGNPVEKAQFNFSLQPHAEQVWFDRDAKIWKQGAPPSQ